MTEARPLLHILGAGRWQLPGIRLAKRLGCRVLVTDMYAERPGYAEADHHEVIDIRERELTLDAARRHGVSGIVCDTTDAGVPTASFVAESLGLNGIGFEIAKNFRDKYRMRQLAASNGIDVPRFELVSTLEELRVAADDIGYPVIIKPVDGQSSRGVTRVADADGLARGYAEACTWTQAGVLLVEECMQGTEVTVEGYAQDGRPHTVGISDKDHYSDGPTVATRLTYPADQPPEMLRRIEEVNARVVSALGLRDGVTHAEYMVEGERVRLIEVAARGGGTGVFSRIVPWLAGADVPKALVEWALGRPFVVERQVAPHERAAHLEFLDLPEGTVREISGVDAALGIPGVEEIALEIEVGDAVGTPRDDRSRPGFFIVFGPDRGAVLDRAAQVKRTLRVEVDRAP